MIPDHLRIQPGQQALTSEQEAEARRFADELIRRQLSTEPVDESEAEASLRQAYAVAGLAPPQRVWWFDGPLPLVAVLAPHSFMASVLETVEASVGASVLARVRTSIEADLWAKVMESVEASVGASIRASVGESVEASIRASVGLRVEASVWERVGDRIWDGAIRKSIDEGLEESIWLGVGAYMYAQWLAVPHFFAVYLASNDLHALACFNERVSGYWLGKETAILVRRPRVLARDQEGHLHSATGKCIEYHDGWGVYAWHGVWVPEKVILAPEALTREDFLKAEDVEVRRVMQERMGDRFVPELGGVVIDSDPPGMLYEVALPDDDPEGVARYVQVQDASTERSYFLRVPPTIQTAAEAVAWSFQVGVEDYHPAQET